MEKKEEMFTLDKIIAQTEAMCRELKEENKNISNNSQVMTQESR